MAEPGIIKTTARYQETDEPLRQRPVIQVAPALPNTVRASLGHKLESARERDNPFRPDGAIYRSADPIVDYYKQGQNQSRAQSPSDSQLALGAQSGRLNGSGETDELKVKRSRSCCARALLCCCCCPWSCCAKPAGRDQSESNHERSYAVGDATKANQMARASKETYRTSSAPLEAPEANRAETAKQQSRCAIV